MHRYQLTGYSNSGPNKIFLVDYANMYLTSECHGFFFVVQYRPILAKYISGMDYFHVRTLCWKHFQHILAKLAHTQCCQDRIVYNSVSPQ